MSSLSEPTQTPSESETAYPFSSSETERKRLDLQHKVFLNSTNNIQIYAPVELDGPGASVLESGTGSGAWLLDLAKTLPTTTELVGIDIQSGSFPPPSELPPNLAFHEMPILSLPPEWANKFTMVHQRMIFGSLRRDEWIVAFRNIYDSLKPGGWFQLFETNEWTNRGPMFQSLSDFMEIVIKAYGGEGVFPKGHTFWNETMEKAGFVDIRVAWFESSAGDWAGSDGADLRKVLVYVMTQLEELVLKNDGFGMLRGGEEGYRKFLEGLEKELKEGVTKPGAQWVMILGKKPEAA